jgi:hypothetical protein
LVRVFRPVAQIAVLAVCHTGHALALGGTGALGLIRDDHSGNIPAALEQLAGECLGRVLVPSTWGSDIQDIPALIHGPPRRLALAIDGEKDLTQMPFVTGLRPPMAEPIRTLSPKLVAPSADRLTGDDHPAGAQEFFPIALAEAEPGIAPDRVAAELDRETVMLLVSDGWWVQAPRRAHPVSADKPLNKLTYMDPPLPSRCTRADHEEVPMRSSIRPVL